MREIELVTHKCIMRMASETSGSRLLKGTNRLFASKDRVRPVSKQLCIIFMACSCPNFVLGRLNIRHKLFFGASLTLALYSIDIALHALLKVIYSKFKIQA